MSTRFLFCTLALGVGVVTACSGAENTGLFAPGDDTSNGGTDSGGTVDSASPTPDSGGGTMDAGMMQQPDTSVPQDAAPPPHDSAPPPVDSAPPPDPGVACSDAVGGYCSVPDESCCILGIGTSTMPVGTCTQSGQCFDGVEVPCDNARECNEIDPGQNEVCCGTTTARNGVAEVSSVACTDPADCTTDNSGVILCDPNDATACPTGTTCKKSTETLPGYYLCLTN